MAAFVEKRPLLCILIVIAYIASPIDILPEGLIGPIGLFDDALVGIAAVALLKRAAKARLSKPKAAVAEIPPPQRQPERPRPPRDDRPQRQDRGPRRNDRNQRWKERRRGDRQQDPRRGDQRP